MTSDSIVLTCLFFLAASFPRFHPGRCLFPADGKFACNINNLAFSQPAYQQGSPHNLWKTLFPSKGQLKSRPDTVFSTLLPVACG
ncbi:MAG: hypothetical protein ACJ8G3_08185 [Burkholderiaceae bacterium]